MKREEGHIGLGQGVLLVYTVLVAGLFVQLPDYVIQAGGPAAWQVALVMTAGALLLALPMAALAKRFPGQGLAEISEAVAGPVLGTLLTLVVSLWLMGSLSLSIRNFTETFITAMLPQTPPSALVIVVMICLIFASYRGLEPLARSTQVLLPIIAAGVLVVLLANLPRAEASRLFPFWGYGWLPTATSGLYLTSIMTEAIVLLVVGYSFRSGQMLGRAGLTGILLFGLTTTVTVAVLIMAFGAPSAAQMPFPMFVLARMIYGGRFLQRVESLIVMFWFFAAAVRLAALFHGSVVSLAGALRLPYFRPLTLPVGLLAATLSLVPEDFMSVLRLDRDWIRPLGFVAWAVPIVLLLLAAVRRKGADHHAA